MVTIDFPFLSFAAAFFFFFSEGFLHYVLVTTLKSLLRL